MSDAMADEGKFVLQDNGFLTARVTIANQRGLHARAAAKFVKVAEKYKAEIMVKRGEVSCFSCAGEQVSGHSIMGLMMLAASIGTEIYIGIRATDAAVGEAALTELVALVQQKFGED